MTERDSTGAVVYEEEQSAIRKRNKVNYQMSDKELVAQFFIEGYQNKNYDFILNCLSDHYIDHSPAGARSNQDAVNILIAVSKMFGDMEISIEAFLLRRLKISKWQMERLWNHGGTGLIRRLKLC